MNDPTIITDRLDELQQEWEEEVWNHRCGRCRKVRPNSRPFL